MIRFILVFQVLFLSAAAEPGDKLGPPEIEWSVAAGNADLAREGFERSQRSMRFWLKHRVEPSGLYGDRADRGKVWNVHNAAADNYAFHVLTSALTDRDCFNGEILDMLKSEIKLTSRDLGDGRKVLPDSWNLVENCFVRAKPNIYAVTFGVSEYCKDGLMPVSEWLGTETPWYERMIQITDELWKSYANGRSDQGKDVVIGSEDLSSTRNVEIHGEQLQILPRLYWATKDNRYKEWAVRLGDHYLLGNHHPTRDFGKLRLRDHGNEIISGLTELYAMLSLEGSHKADEYRQPIYEMLDVVLKYGRNADGLFHDDMYPKTKKRQGRTADNFGYVYNAFYIAYMIDRDSENLALRRKVERYRREIIRGLENLDQEKYRNFKWEWNSSDGYADAIEGAINLNNRLHLSRVDKWIDSEIKVMWNMQGEKGYSQLNYPDGNFCRTTLMYSLWKTRGVHSSNWRKDLAFGAVETPCGEGIGVFVTAGEKKWKGKLCFDQPRHLTFFNMPLDYPRINSFPEWFTVEADRKYKFEEVGGKIEVFSGSELIEGLEIELEKGQVRRFVVTGL